MNEETKQIIASNLTIAAALIQVANAIRKKTTTSDGDSEAINIYSRLLAQMKEKIR